MAAWSHRAADVGLARRIAASLGVSEPLAAVLARSFADEAEAERHLRPQLAHVSDPFAVGGLREAAERLVSAAAKGERIAILGDYDVDGVSSTAMLVHFLRRLGARPLGGGGGFSRARRSASRMRTRNCWMPATCQWHKSC